MAESVSEFFEGLEAAADADKLAGIDTSYLFEIDGAGDWLVAIHDGHLHVSEGAGEADCIISASADTFLKIANGEQNATSAYMTGKIKIKGDMGAAMKLQKLF
jgi:putative sterol carrier protein